MAERKFYLEYAVRAVECEQYPLDWEAIFQRKAPLAVEIGFGNGEFLINRAQQNPGWNFIGIELSLESMFRLQKRLHQKGLANVRPVREDARFAMREFFADSSLRRVLMNFPDPWPKDRHKSRRLLNDDFVQILGAVLEEKGAYELVTDQQWYAEHAHALFAQSPYFEVQPVEKNPARPVATKYEQKWRSMGRDTWRVLARKIQTATINRLLEDISMPHTFVEKEILPHQVRRLIGTEHLESGIFFIIKAGYSALENGRFLLRVIARDESFKQEFYILITRRKERRWLVKLDPAVQPYRTPAVKLAVWKTGELLNGMDT
jgi:tRNA (guanine-N7-)-methyltransferase